MTNPQDATEVPAFDLPDWGEEGAPSIDLDQPEERAVAVTTATSDTPVLVTTDAVGGFRVTEYLGVVGGEASVSSDGPIDSAVREARAVAIDLLRSEAVSVGADAVLGTRIQVVLKKKTAVAVVIGTAVRLTPNRGRN